MTEDKSQRCKAGNVTLLRIIEVCVEHSHSRWPNQAEPKIRGSTNGGKPSARLVSKVPEQMQWQEWFSILEWQVDLPKDKDGESDSTADKNPNDVRDVPGVQSTTPSETHEEDENAEGVEDQPNPIKSLEEILCGSRTMKHLERWWMIEEVPAEDRDKVDGNAKVEAASPSDRCLRLNRDSDLGSQRVCGQSECICTTVSDVSILHRHDLGDDPRETDLKGST